jgi:hypothetical protein
VPDRNGVYHACADDKTGALRVVAIASSCRKPKTVKRGKRRVRIPGESAIAWNQQGRPGANGTNAATHVIVRTHSATISGGTNDAFCNPGERAVGGGIGRTNGGTVSTDAVAGSIPAVASSPARDGATPDAWIGSWSSPGNVNITTWVVCASP